MSEYNTSIFMASICVPMTEANKGVARSPGRAPLTSAPRRTSSRTVSQCPVSVATNNAEVPEELGDSLSAPSSIKVLTASVRPYIEQRMSILVSILWESYEYVTK